MSETPLGYNPVGEHAPGLPRHDAPLPGHVPGSYSPMGGDSFGAAGGGAYSYGNAGVPLGAGNVGFSPGSADWFGRVVIAVATYLTLPVQLALYPIAGIPAAAVGYIVYHVWLASGAGFDTSMGWAWFAAWIALLLATRLDTGLATRVPHYRTIRHIVRLALLALWMFYFAITDHGDTPAMALIVALFTALIGHFILRSKWLRWIWGNLQYSAWLRKERPPLPV